MADNAAGAARPEDIVRLIDIRKTYFTGDLQVPVLKGINATVKRGEFVGFIGTSGSGKSTLLNLLGCLDTATAGEYYLDGISVREMSRNDRATLRNRKIGFVFQSYNLLPKTTALENVELPLLYRGLPRAERHEKVMEALERVGLADWSRHTPSELSGGQQQRVAIARALVTRPRLLLADEPTGSLDSARSVEIMELLTELNREDGITIALVTHEPDMAKFARRHLLFRDGELISDTVGGLP